LYQFFLGALHDPELADDLTQELVLRLLKSCDFNPEGPNDEGYLYTSARRLLSEHIRGEGRAATKRSIGVSEKRLFAPEVSEPDVLAMNEERQQLLSERMKELKLWMESAFRLHYWEGMPWSAVYEQLKLNEYDVSRARAELYRLLLGKDKSPDFWLFK